MSDVEEPFSEVVSALEPWRQQNRHDAWHPVTGTSEEEPGHSRFGGRPDLLANEPWPVCKMCDRPMQFFVQLDLASLPPGATDHTAGLLQLFYCVLDDDFNGCDDYEPFSESHLLRIIDPSQPLKVPSTTPGGMAVFPTKPINGWDRLDDYPSPAEFDRLGLFLEYDFSPGAATVSVRWPAGDVAFDNLDADAEPEVAESISNPADKDKLGGWPKWVQGVEYPCCPKCGEEMAYLFQIDSQDHLPYDFGDLGRGHVTYCRTHRDVLAFGWACS